MDTFKNILRCAAGAGCILLYVWGYVIYEHTLVDWWLPATGAVVVVLFTFGPLSGLWPAVTGSADRWINIACHVFVMGAMGWFAFLGGNGLGADIGSDYDETVTVTEKITATRNRYHRAGRRMVRYDTYKVYYLRLEFESGRSKRVPVSLARYNKVREGGQMTLPVSGGRFGFPVVR